MQTRHNLKVLLLVHILAIRRHLGALNLALLLHLSQSNPLFHGQVLPNLGERILGLAEALQERAVVDGVQEDVIVGSVWRDECPFFLCFFRLI